MDAQGTVYEDGAVAVRGADIVAVGATAALTQRFGAGDGERIDASGRIVLPGLINLHTHGADSLFRGLIDDLPLEPWLERLWQVERQFLDPETVGAGALLAYAEMIRGGTTTALDMFWYPEAGARAAGEIGFRLLTGPVWFDSPEIDGLQPADRLARGREFLQEYRDHPLVTPCVLPHGTYTVAPGHLEQARDLAEEFDLLLSTHLSETVREVETVRERYGRRPPEHLDQLRMLGPRTVLAHCVHLDAREVDLLAERRSVVAHCPLSNLKLGSGVAPLPALRRTGVRLGLGTDGPVSGNDLDLWLTMRLAAVLHKGVHRDPTVLSAREVVALATREAADALDKADEIGSLEPGKRADLIVIRLDRPHLVPLYDPYSHLVYNVGRGDVETVVIHGRPVLDRNRLTTVDEGVVLGEVRSIAERVEKFAPTCRTSR
jgi:5-methylthioadenosine/S-adenosylhomocysteine deaminase